MIFTLKNAISHGEFLPPKRECLDVFCFFSQTEAIEIPEGEWFSSVLTSLRCGNDVLILENPLVAVPELNFSSRWELGDNWIWLAPRSRRHLFETYRHISPTLISIKQSLKTLK